MKPNTNKNMERKTWINLWINNNAKPFMREILTKAENPIGVIMTTMLGLACRLDDLEEGREKWTIEAKLIVLDNLWQTINEKMGC